MSLYVNTKIPEQALNYSIMTFKTLWKMYDLLLPETLNSSNVDIKCRDVTLWSKQLRETSRETQAAKLDVCQTRHIERVIKPANINIY